MKPTSPLDRMSNTLLSAAVGAALMYFMDPQQGRRRIATLRDKLVHYGHAACDLTDAGLRDLANRASGLVAEGLGALRSSAATDGVLVDRVRAQLGRMVSHPHAVQVTAQDGCVTLEGPILRSEADRLLQAVGRVRGVRDVENRLDVHERAGDTPALQGGRMRTGPRSELMQQQWSAGPRLLVAAAGGVLAWYGLGRRGVAGTLAGAAGLGLATRAITNRQFSDSLHLAPASSAIDIRKSIHIAAPRERVYDLWCDAENFPRFMSMVEEVRVLDGRRQHWVVKGPAGARLEWDAEIVEQARPGLLAWCAEPGATVQHAGSVRFDDENGGTRVTVHLSYRPPGGALGHGVASLLGRDPKQQLDADLMRMKSFVETGRVPHDAAQRTGTAPLAGDTPRPSSIH